MADPRAPGEAVIDFPAADREDLRAGSVIKFVIGGPDARPDRLAAVDIVGIVASPGQFPAVGASAVYGSVYLMPAFVRGNGIRPSPGDASLLIRLRRGAASRGAFLRQLRAAGLGGVDVPEVRQAQTAGIQRSIRLESQALWALSVLIGLAALAIVGQSLARQTYLDSADLPARQSPGDAQQAVSASLDPGKAHVPDPGVTSPRPGRRAPGTWSGQPTPAARTAWVA